MRSTAITALLVAFLLTFVPVPGLSLTGVQAQSSMVPYTVQPGDTLTKIANKYCTTWQEVYQLNAAVIGPDPNNVEPGMVLYVPNRCTAPPPSSGGVYDHGPSMYANGTVAGNIYTVVYGDTWYSIGQRFGLPWETISTANGGGGLYPGRQLVIPGLQPASPAKQPYITIQNPQPGAMLPNTFTVSGTGGGLYEGNVLVRALDNSGRVLAEKATTLLGANVGVGGDGTWSTQLSVNAYDVMPGAIEATSPGTPAMYAVSITYSGAGSAPPTTAGDIAYYAPGQCTISGAPGAPMYAYPGGPMVSYFVAGGPVEAKQRVVYNSMDWYMIQPEASMGNPPMWVPVSSLSSVGQGCN
jgi:LysM repeat protein